MLLYFLERIWYIFGKYSKRKTTFMKKQFFISSLAITFLAMLSCTNEKNKSIDTTISTTETQTNAQDEIVKSIVKNKQGKTMEMSFNNTKDIVTVVFEGNSIEMKSQKPASGIWYFNDHYELRGKGSEVELSKDGKIIFEGK